MKNENIEKLIQKNTENREHFGAVSNRQAVAKISENRAMEELRAVREEAARMGQDKEVQIMLTQEFFDEMDWNSYRHQWKEEGLEEGRKEGR